MTRDRTRSTVRREQVPLRGRSRMPCIVVDSGAPGPSVVVTANLHGDEVTGVVATHALLRTLPDELLHGKVTLFPSLNPKGLERGSRCIPGDPEDPNRTFPGVARGTVAQQHAHAVWRALEAHRPDVVIDVHADSVSAIPYALVDRVIGGYPQLFLRCAELAEASGFTVLHEYPLAQYHAFGLAKSFSGAIANGMGRPSITLEIGPRRSVEPAAVDAAVAALEGILAHIGLLQKRSGSHPSKVSGGPWRRENGPRTQHTGLLVPMVLPGIVLEAGAVIVEVRDVGGATLDSLVMPSAGFVVSFPDQAWLGAGMAAATLGVADT